MTLLVSPPARDEFPPFEPHPFLRNGHLQTIVARYMPGPRVRLPSTYHQLDVEDDVALAVLESVPPGWREGDPCVVLVHGLAGCVRSPYLSRVGRKLYRGGRPRGPDEPARGGVGVRDLADVLSRRPVGRPPRRRRMACPAGTRLADRAGRLLARGQLGAEACGRGGQRSPRRARLRRRGQPADRPEGCLRAHPSAAWAGSTTRTSSGSLKVEEERLRFAFPELSPCDFSRAGNLFEFDDVYTAPRNGFRDADEYYARNSSVPLIPEIRTPGLVIHAADDPFIPVEPFLTVRFPRQLALELNPHGGHLGYLSRVARGGDRRWLDARIAAYLASRWGIDRGDSEPPARGSRPPGRSRTAMPADRLQ